MKKFSLSLLPVFLILLVNTPLNAQGIEELILDASSGLSVTGVTANGMQSALPEALPLFSFEINDEQAASDEFYVAKDGSKYTFAYNDIIEGAVTVKPDTRGGINAAILFTNTSSDTIEISNVVPLGASDDHIYISASGPWSLTRAKLFRPGKAPIGITIPDNIWEMGYASIPLGGETSFAAMSRRTGWSETSTRRRWRTIIPPNGTVTYNAYYDVFNGEWQNGLKLFFHERYLYDLAEFDNSLYEREDLEWIRHDYTMILVMAWDRRFYDSEASEYTYQTLIEEGNKYFGGYDVLCFWPTWPALGMDQRNQWDMYRNMPGGLSKLNDISQDLKKHGTKFFISYNPWDKSTRMEDHYEGLSELIKLTDSDGVVIDTRGKSSYELQAAADKARPGVIMYSEGMAVTKDMPGIVSGRVHNAIYYQPELNLNKLIKPKFAIFRVIDPPVGRYHREVAVSFFNGYGNELNMFRPGRPAYMHEDNLYMGKLAKIQETNSNAFLSDDWTPLIQSQVEKVWVNEWPIEEKTVYTILSMNPEGSSGSLFEVKGGEGKHYVDLYNHTEITPDTVDGKLYAAVPIEPFNKDEAGTRTEGNVGCVAEFNSYLDVTREYTQLKITAGKGNRVEVWAGNPSYQNDEMKSFGTGDAAVDLYEHFGSNEGKFVVQLFDDEELIDERVVEIELGMPVLSTKVTPTEKAEAAPDGMVEVPAGEYTFKTTHADDFVKYPDYSKGLKKNLDKFFIDKYPVTNSDFKDFIDATHYTPDDTLNFLKHWVDGTYKQNEAEHPVVYISLEDAKAYAEWAGKRLPTEVEWQYAAQAGNGDMQYPWGMELDTTKCNNASGATTPVTEYPEGENKWGVADLVGNVWQMTNDVYDTGAYYYLILKGGSYFKPTSSIWYVQSGPQKLTHTQWLLMVEEGFERNSTIGFRCVKDAK